MGILVRGLPTLESSLWNSGGVTKASQSLQDREIKISAIYEKMEDNLELVGAIGVEDKLQDGVKDTLVALGQAGIKVKPSISSHSKPCMTPCARLLKRFVFITLFWLMFEELVCATYFICILELRFVLCKLHGKVWLLCCRISDLYVCFGFWILVHFSSEEWALSTKTHAFFSEIPTFGNRFFLNLLSSEFDQWKVSKKILASIDIYR